MSFPLVIWQHTKEYEKEFKEAEKEFERLYKKWFSSGGNCTYIGSLRFNEDGFPEIWLNASGKWDSYYGRKRRWPSEESLKNALQYGDSGWWTLDEFSQFLEGKGPIVVRAMWNNGFRRYKNGRKWARIKKWDEQPVKCHKTDAEKMEGEEAVRLANIIKFPNESAGLDRTFSLKVGKRGMIYIVLEVNPFGATRTEDLGRWGALLNVRGHLAVEQDGFRLEAKNININGEKYIYVKAVYENGATLLKEGVWPTQIPASKLHELIVNFTTEGG